ncbi:hypothetical protein ACQP3F_33085, partial [Escherichia coli]
VGVAVGPWSQAHWEDMEESQRLWVFTAATERPMLLILLPINYLLEHPGSFFSAYSSEFAFNHGPERHVSWGRWEATPQRSF